MCKKKESEKDLKGTGSDMHLDDAHNNLQPKARKGTEENSGLNQKVKSSKGKWFY